MKKKEKKKENSERWLLTYSDLITLLMALFVILYASSNVDKTKYQQISSSLHQAFSMGDSGNIGAIEGNPTMVILILKTCRAKIIKRLLKSKS